MKKTSTITKETTTPNIKLRYVIKNVVTGGLICNRLLNIKVFFTLSEARNYAFAHKLNADSYRIASIWHIDKGGKQDEIRAVRAELQSISNGVSEQEIQGKGTA